MVLISSKFITFLPKKHSYNSTIEIKSKTGARFEPAAPKLLPYPSTDCPTQKVIII